MKCVHSQATASKTLKVIYWIETNLENLKIKPYYPPFIIANFALVAFQWLPQALSCLPILSNSMIVIKTRKDHFSKTHFTSIYWMET